MVTGVYSRFFSKRLVILASLVSASLGLAGCSFASTAPNADQASESSQSASKSGSEKKYPHADYVNALSGVSKEEREKIVASVPLEKRALLDNAISWAASGNFYSYSSFEQQFRKARTDPQRNQALPSYEQDSTSGPADTDLVLRAIEDNVDFRYFAYEMAKFVRDRVKYPFRTVYRNDGYESIALNEPQFEAWMDELQMTKEESEAARKSLEYFFAKNELSWQDYADSFAESYYSSNSHDFSTEELRNEMTKQQYSEKEIKAAIKHLEDTIK